jgi:N-acetylmuramoyl-L-alanine amidase
VTINKVLRKKWYVIWLNKNFVYLYLKIMCENTKNSYLSLSNKMPYFFKLLLLTFFFNAYCLLAGEGQKPKPKGKFQTLVIDAGHGGKDPGTIGSYMKEKDITLPVSLKLAQLMKKYLPEVKTILTRDEDKFLELEDRAQFANKNKADFFLSIHVNAAARRDAKKKKDVILPHIHGSETYVMGINNEGRAAIAKRENSAMLLEDNYKKTYNGFDPESDEAYIIMSNFTSANVDQSASMAAKIQHEYKSRCGRLEKGVHRQSLWVLWRTEMPAVLTELGYITNLEEEKFLASEKGQNYLATSIFLAIRKYKDELEGNTKKYDDEAELLAPLKINEESEKSDTAKKVGASVRPEIIEKQNTSKNVEMAIVKKDCTSVAKEEPKEVVKPVKEKSDAEIKSNFEKIFESNKNPIYDYMVQIEVSVKKPDFNQDKYKDIENLDYHEVGVLYKITSGKFKSQLEASNHQQKLKKQGFPQAFVITFKNGKRIE